MVRVYTPHSEKLLILVLNRTRKVVINVTLSRLRTGTADVEKPYYILRVCVYSLSYPASNAHAPYRHLWPVRHYNIFPHYLTNGKIFRETLLNINCVFLLSPQILPAIFLTLRSLHRYKQPKNNSFKRTDCSD